MKTLRIPSHIVAIDCHVHPNAKEHEASDGEYVAVAKKYFKTDVGFVEFVAKPISTRELPKIVRKHLRS